MSNPNWMDDVKMKHLDTGEAERGTKKLERFPPACFPLHALGVYEWRRPSFRMKTAGQSRMAAELYMFVYESVCVYATPNKRAEDWRGCVRQSLPPALTLPA